METIESINLISINPDVRGGQPCIAGTGLRVADIAIAHIFHHRSPGEIASDYAISLAAAHAALSYYYRHKQEIDEEIRRQMATARKHKEQRSGRE